MKASRIYECGLLKINKFLYKYILECYNYFIKIVNKLDLDIVMLKYRALDKLINKFFGSRVEDIALKKVTYKVVHFAHVLLSSRALHSCRRAVRISCFNGFKRNIALWSVSVTHGRKVQSHKPDVVGLINLIKINMQIMASRYSAIYCKSRTKFYQTMRTKNWLACYFIYQPRKQKADLKDQF